jgi:hypothetical protein
MCSSAEWTGDFARPPPNELGTDDVVTAGAVVAVDSAEEHIGGEATDRLDVLSYDGNSEDIGECHVVKPHQSNVAISVELPQRLDRSGRQKDLAGEERGRWFG